jgi:DNA-binding response OmpR family regulator
MNPRKKILIIDEEVDLCLLMKAYFLRKNYEVYISHSCHEALSLANDCQPNIIFLPIASCQNQEKDIEKIREAFPDAEIIINNHHNYPDR